MARSRFPAPWAIAQLVFRSICVALCLATIAVAIYESARYGYGSAMVGAFVASIWAITVDAPEIAGLLDSTRRTRRCTEGYMAFLSCVTMLICICLPLAVQLAVLGIGHDCGGGRPVEVCREEERLRNEDSNVEFLAWALPVVVGAIHFWFMVAGCVGPCKRKRHE